MKSFATKLPITAAEYLEGERSPEVRHEFVDGRIYAMSGASLRHNEICGDVCALLKSHLRGGPCRTFIEAVKVELADDLTESYYYPDVFVTCEPADDDSHVRRRADRWKKHIYTQFDSLVHLESIGLSIPVSAFYQSAPFPDDVERPWYLRYREDG